MRVLELGLVTVCVCLLSACGGSRDPTSASSGDCIASVRWHGVVYIVNTHVDQRAPKGRVIGPGAVVDCDHRTVVDRVVVASVKGVDRRQAISVRGSHHGVYVAEGLPRAQWPAVVRSD